MDKHYHIDVTPEEDLLFRDKPEEMENPKKFTNIFSRTFWLVFGVHALGISVFVISCSALDSKNELASLVDYSKPIPEIPKTYQAQANPKEKQSNIPATPPQAPTSRMVSAKKQYATEHIVKKGDTLYSIAKKYKLSCKRLIEINKIKDPNKIVIGQSLKFVN